MLGGVGSGAEIAIRNHQTNVPTSAPSAQEIFQMPFTESTYTTLSPSFQSGTGVSPGQTITGWDGFTVLKQPTDFQLLFGEQADQSQPSTI